MKPGTVLSHYEILGQAGAGGMGVVYRARDTRLDRIVALKTLGADSLGDAEQRERFVREAKTASALSHPNIVTIYDIDVAENVQLIAMEFVDGQPLTDLIPASGLPIERALDIASQVADAMGTAHAAGITHRDLKPGNIMVTPEGRVKVLDFGLAKKLLAEGDHTTAALTATGTILGTTPYMSPEQATGEPVGSPSDVFSLGIILYEMISGTRPFAGNSVVATLSKILNEDPAPLRSIRPGVSPALEAAVQRALAKDPAHRYQTMEELRTDLAKVADKAAVAGGLARRVVWLAGLATAAVLATLWAMPRWSATGPAVPAMREPVSVLVSDFHNATGDPSLDRAVEPVVRLTLEGAGFITAYDRTGVRSLGVRPPETLDEQAAIELAVKQGVNIVIAGTVAPRDGGYDVSARAIEAVTGTVVATESDHASRMQEVLGAATGVADRVRRTLGDSQSDSVKRFALETLSAQSIDAVREYAKGMDGFSRSQFDESLKAFTKAIDLDPTFGMAYGGMAISLRNLDRQQEAVKYANEALRYLDSMTERERFRARGLYYYITSDYQTCVKEYGDLIAKYSADVAARNNRALCLTYLRDLPRAVSEMREVVKILPNRALYRENLALYSAYSGDFSGAEQQVGAMKAPGLFALLARAFAEIGQGRIDDATRTYGALAAAVPDEGPSYASSGLGDLAIYEGRYADAVNLLSRAAESDVRANSPDKAARKLVAMAYAELQRSGKAAAIAAAERAVGQSPAVKTRFLAARVFIEAGASAKAEAIAAELKADLLAEPQAYAAILDGLRELAEGDYRRAIGTLTDANTRFDTWIGHFDLGRAYLAAGIFPQADSEFDRCLQRRGEALSLFLDEEPTAGVFPAVFYYQGRVREGLQSLNFADSYRAYLQIRGDSKEDALSADARARVK